MQMIFFICFKMKSAENVFEFLNCQHENIKLTVEKQIFSNPVFKKAFYIVWWYGTNWQNSDASETEIWICIHDIVEQWNPSKPICLKWSQLVMHSLQEFDIFECLLNLTISLRKLKEIKNQIIKVQFSFATFVVQFQESLSRFFIHQESRTYTFF